MKPFIRSAHNYDMRAASLALATQNPFPTLTQQSHSIETDINVLVRRFGLTGQITGVSRPPLPADFEVGVFDFQSAMNQIRAAEESFNAMSSDVRFRFNNDPHLFVEFCSDPSNLPELRKMGLAVPEPSAPPPPEPLLVRISSDSPPASTAAK